MKKSLIVVTLVSAMAGLVDAGAQTPDGLTVLYDQTTISAEHGKAAQNFETARDAQDCEAADDFVIPAQDQWQVDQVVLVGRYRGASGSVLSVDISIHEDIGRPGPLLCAGAGVVIDDAGGALTVDLDSACVLGPGSYWISAQADLAFGESLQWYWDCSQTEVGAHAMWRDPGGGLPTLCTDWGTLPDCFGSGEFSFLFALRGRGDLIFADGFETGGTGAWTAAVP